MEKENNRNFYIYTLKKHFLWPKYIWLHKCGARLIESELIDLAWTMINEWTSYSRTLHLIEKVELYDTHIK